MLEAVQRILEAMMEDELGALLASTRRHWDPIRDRSTADPGAARLVGASRTSVLARPTGVEREDATTIRMPIEGAQEADVA